MRYFIIAGEKSGDLHAANLVRELQALDPHAQIQAWGGENIAATGATVLQHYRELAFMGFWEVIRNLWRIRRFLHLCQQHIMQFRPDAVILVDYGGFNMRIASFCRQQGIRTFYYISPKVWAWNTSRAYHIKRTVDHMLVIFPFEKDFYARFQYEVDYVGNPIMDAIRAYRPQDNFLQEHGLNPDQRLVALLPGSRKQEIESLLPIMLEASLQFPDIQFAVAAISQLPTGWYRAVQKYPRVHLIYDSTYDLLAHAHAAVVASGTATLETALFRVPQLVVYRTNWLNYSIAKALAKVPYISLVNLVMQQALVPELIQKDCNAKSIAQQLKLLLSGKQRENMLKGYESLHEQLGEAGASARAAQLIVDYLVDKNQ